MAPGEAFGIFGAAFDDTPIEVACARSLEPTTTNHAARNTWQTKVATGPILSGYAPATSSTLVAKPRYAMGLP